MTPLSLQIPTDIGPLLVLLAALLLGLLLGILLASAIAAARLARARSEAIRLQTRLETLSAARSELLDQFQLLSSSILNDQSKRFTDQNANALSTLLSPLADKITDFRQRIELVHNADVQQRSALKQQVESLTAQNADVGLKADRLADALKGSNKILGTWGEITLQRLLEASGLQPDRDYSTQKSFSGPDNQRLQPDVIVHLPENRCVIIDSKMSLSAYLDFHNTENPDLRNRALLSHIQSLEKHVKELAAKHYHDIPALADSSPDFVLMFIPSEPALTLALTQKPAILETAARSNILLTGPGGLLSALRLIALLWRQSNQNKAASAIFDTVRKIYEKYASFAEDLQQIDNHLLRARDAYNDAFKTLSTGPGNLLHQMESFRRENYIRPKKIPPKAFIPENPNEESPAHEQT